MVAAQVALSLTALLGVAALAVDGGLLLAERRRAQAVADAAALAGAVDLFKRYPTNSGVDTAGGDARKSALAVAADNNYGNDGTTSTVTVNIPPATARTAYFNGKAGYVEVNVTYYRTRGLSGIWGSAPLPVSAHAIARGQWVIPNQGVITLNPTASSAIKLSGGGTLTVSGGSVVDDSNSGSAFANTGGGSVTANGIYVVGGVSGGGTYSPTPVTGAPAMEDPLKALPAPSPPPAGTINKTSLGSGNFRYVLTPGSYDGNGGPALPNFGSGDQVVFLQASKDSSGIFYLYKGLSDNGANLLMDSAGTATLLTSLSPSNPYTSQGTTGGMMFYNAGSGSSQSFGITGNATGNVNLTALDGSVAGTNIYKGILYFQSRTSSQDVTVSGNGNFTMLGTFYAPGAGLKITGNTSTPPSIIGSQYIADNLTLSGGGSVNVNFSSGIVAPVRYLNLVE
jgi:hypothetical protein